MTVGAGSMIGAGVFSAWGPATDAAGTAVLIGLVVAAAVAFCNATSSAQLAAVHPESGGTYVYARRQLGPVWGYLAGWGFVIGKTASCVAIALTAGAYLWPDHARLVGVVAVGAVAVVNIGGLTRTVLVTKCLLAVALVALASVVIAGWSSPDTSLERLTPVYCFARRRPARRRVPVLRLRRLCPHRHARRGGSGSGRHHPQGDSPGPGRRIGRSTPSSASRCSPPFPSKPSRRAMRRSASSSAPRDSTGSRRSCASVPASLRSASSSTSSPASPEPCWRWHGAASCRSWFSKVDDRRSLPLRAEAVVTAVVIALTATLDLRGAIGFSSVTILTYYAITNAAGLTLRQDQRRWPRAIGVVGLAGCAALAVMLPVAAILTGTCVLVAGIAIRGLAPAARRHSRSPTSL